jgi:hypothetical protein
MIDGCQAQGPRHSNSVQSYLLSQPPPPPFYHLFCFHTNMSTSLVPPLRSALKHPSRPSSPTSGRSASLSPTVSRVPLPSEASPKPRTAFAETDSITRTQSSSSIPNTTSLLSPPSPHHHHNANAAGYTPKVSFDTFENPVASMFSFTLQVKTEGYKRTRNTRAFLCASSPDESGREALDWALEYLVQDGDELIVFRGVDEDVLGTRDLLYYYAHC